MSCVLFKVLGIQDVMGFEFMDPPSPQQLSEVSSQYPHHQLADIS